MNESSLIDVLYLTPVTVMDYHRIAFKPTETMQHIYTTTIFTCHWPSLLKCRQIQGTIRKKNPGNI